MLIGLLTVACTDPPDDAACAESFVDTAPRAYDGTVHTADDGTTYCIATPPLESWCLEHLPCWNEPRCPKFDAFVATTGWLRESDYDFTGMVSDGYGAGKYVDCTGLDILSNAFYWTVEGGLTLRGAYFDIEDRSLIGIGLSDDNQHSPGSGFTCGSTEGVREIWYGTFLPREERTRSDECKSITGSDDMRRLHTGGMAQPTGCDIAASRELPGAAWLLAAVLTRRRSGRGSMPIVGPAAWVQPERE